MTHNKIKLLGLIVATIVLFVTIAVSKNRSRINIGIYRTKIITPSHKHIDCAIYFYKHGHYIVDLCNHTIGEVIEDYYLSWGDYSVNNKEVILKDKTFGFQMTLYMDNDTLTAGQSFACMENRKFTYCCEHLGGYNPYSKISASQLEKKRKKFNDTHPRPAPLDFGEYNYTNFPVSLYIQSDSSYKLEYRNIIVEEGKWERNRNILIFYDKHINSISYLFINEDGSLTSCFRPEGYPEYVLAEKKEPQ